MTSKTMIKTTIGTTLAFAIAGLATLALTTSAPAQNQHMEVIHHPNYDKSVFMPFVPGIKIKSMREKDNLFSSILPQAILLWAETSP